MIRYFLNASGFELNIISEFYEVSQNRTVNPKCYWLIITNEGDT